MNVIAHKIGRYITLSGAVLAFVCTCTWAQDSTPNISPLDRSVHAGVDEIDDRTKEPLPPSDVSKPPQTLSRWSPEMAKQLPATTTWSVKPRVAAATWPDGDQSNSILQPAKPLKALEILENRNGRNMPAAGSVAGIRNFNGNSHVEDNLPAQTDGGTFAHLAIFPVLSAVPPSLSAGMSNPFDRNPFGHEGSLPFPMKSIFADQAIRKNSDVQSHPSTPGFPMPISRDPQANQKP
jgi:hypothetical protein